MFNNPRGRRTQPAEDETPEQLAADADALDPDAPIEVKRAPRLRSAKPVPDDAD